MRFKVLTLINSLCLQSGESFQAARKQSFVRHFSIPDKYRDNGNRAIERRFNFKANPVTSLSNIVLKIRGPQFFGSTALSSPARTDYRCQKVRLLQKLSQTNSEIAPGIMEL